RAWPFVHLRSSERASAGRKIGHERHLQRIGRPEQLIIDTRCAEVLLVAANKSTDFAAVVVADQAWHRHHLLIGFEILEPCRSLKRKIDLVWIENMKNDDIRTAEMKMLDCANDRVGIVEKIGNEHDHAALAQ